jgi:tight adherence protein C
VFFSVYIFARAFFHSEQIHSAKQLLGEGQDKNRKTTDTVIKYSRPFFSRYVVPIIQNMKVDAQRKEAKRKLISAGLTDELTADEYLSMKIFLIFGAPTFLAVVNYAGEFGLDWWVYVISAPLGYLYPDYMVYEKRKFRQKEAKKAMPFIIDLLALSTEAGLDFLGAIGKVVQKATPSPLVDELSQVLKEIKVGSSRAEALREMAARLDMKEISSFVSILVSADEMGASIGKVLRQQSESIRMERSLAAEKEGAKSASKIMMPTFLFILPAIFTMIGVPFFLSSGGGF